MPITIRKIAEMAGVSRGTVDRVLNNRGGVDPDVAKRVSLIAELHEYRPNSIARSLAYYKSNNMKIGLLLNSESNQFYVDVIRGINHFMDQFSDYGVKLVTRVAQGYNVDRQLSLIDELEKEGIQALALTPIDEERVAQKLNSIVERGISVLTINTDIKSVNRIAYVGCDYLQSGKIAAGLFGMISKTGRERIGIVTGSMKVLGHNLRIYGFGGVLKHECPDMSIVDIVENNDNDDVSYTVVRGMMETNPDITALYFVAAGTQGGIRAVLDLGMGGKIHIICYDLTPHVRKYLEDGVVSATICQDPFYQGYQSLRILFEYLLMKKAPEKQINNTKLEIRTKYNIE